MPCRRSQVRSSKPFDGPRGARTTASTLSSAPWGGERPSGSWSWARSPPTSAPSNMRTRAGTRCANMPRRASAVTSTRARPAVPIRPVKGLRSRASRRTLPHHQPASTSEAATAPSRRGPATHSAAPAARTRASNETKDAPAGIRTPSANARPAQAESAATWAGSSRLTRGRPRLTQDGSRHHQALQVVQPRGTDAGDGVELVDRRERAVLLAVLDDLLRGHRADARQRVELLRGRGAERDWRARGRAVRGSGGARRGAHPARRPPGYDHHLLAVRERRGEVGRGGIGTAGEAAGAPDGVLDAVSLDEPVHARAVDRADHVDDDRPRRARRGGRRSRSNRSACTACGRPGAARGRPGAARRSRSAAATDERRDAQRRPSRAVMGVPPDHREQEDGGDGGRDQAAPAGREREGAHAETVPEKPSPVCAGAVPNAFRSIHSRTNSPAAGAAARRRRYTTRLTSLSGTTKARGSLPSMCAWTFSDAFARAINSSSGRPAGTSIRSRTLPFTCSTSTTVSRASSAGSCDGHAAFHRRECPSASHSSSQTCGV